MTATHKTARTSDSTDRIPALAARRTAHSPAQVRTVARIGSAARRILNALMRSLTCPHV